jgi:hypothetical protein
MEVVFCQELKKYSLEELKALFSIDDRAFFDARIIELIERKVLVQNKQSYYAFEYVGLLFFGETILFLLPKYISNFERKTNLEKKTIARQILNLIYAYSVREVKKEIEELETATCFSNYESNNILSIILFILNDYFINGLYSNEKDINEKNGQDQIDWQFTLENVEAILVKNEPVYFDYYTKNNEIDEENYFRILHKFVLTECTNKIKYLGLDAYFSFEKIIYNIDVNRLGHDQVIISKINNELGSQYIFRKQILLKAIAAFISNEQKFDSNETIKFYGTRTFYTIWEKTCGYILNNQYSNYSELISKPIWKSKIGYEYSKETLRPDIISIYNNESDKYFIVTDAKYYNIEFLNNDIVGNPGIDDITKQYLYHLAFRNFINTNGYKAINRLVFPSDEESNQDFGIVSLKILTDIGLDDIHLIKMNAKAIFDLYLNNKKLDLASYLEI